MVNKGTRVVYRGKTYTVIWRYDSGYLELKGDFRIYLVHEYDVKYVK
ncbi:hypothetical protein [Pseudalkalibacillus berkeleyi]|uniref:DUF5348 domain-containing protein n=1 Tax=Pseudalkalibacillus berkeleyi TaxID=1069813 RepID=A0ABS9GXP0_9BACL|nr:hypothetical protein [Pseudalkalibacillus berkeleyi]MCF6136394.1 hypothetical protein [Pseudalkalibacillus berkeleyi]